MSVNQDIDEYGRMQVTENREANMNNQQDVVHLEMPYTKPGRDYRPQYPKKLTLILSFIQLGIAYLAIITQVVLQVSGRSPWHIIYIGTGAWCGILFGLSGAMGIAASLKQNTLSIVGNMIISVVTILFGFTFFIISSIGTGIFSYRSNNTAHAMFAIQMTISIIQIMASSSLTAISSRAICNCCSDDKMSKKSFPKTPMKILCSIQLFIAILIIIMEISVMSSNNPIMPLAGGIWCGVI